MEELNSLYQGVVVSVDDPLKLGRCKVRIPSVHGPMNTSDYDLLPWAVYITPNATGSDRTTFILPEVNDIVWVQFIGGNRDTPAYYGGSFASVNGVSEVPLSDDEYLTTDVIYSKDDAKIYRGPGILTIKYGETTIKITKSGDIEMDTPAALKVTAGGNIDMTAGGSVNIKAPVINLN